MDISQLKKVVRDVGEIIHLESVEKIIMQLLGNVQCKSKQEKCKKYKIMNNVSWAEALKRVKNEQIPNEHSSGNSKTGNSNECQLREDRQNHKNMGILV